jgi:xanthine dehydrogenase/oxidase
MQTSGFLRNVLQVTDEGIIIGGSVTLTTLMMTLKQLCNKLPSYQVSTFHALIKQMHYFAGAQIRNTASVGGNIVTGSPISDINPIYMAAGATFTVIGKGTAERMVKAEEFFIGYRCAFATGIKSWHSSGCALVFFTPGL